MTPDRLHSDKVGRVANKVRVERGLAPFNPYFYIPKYRSSDALPVPEIFCFNFDFLQADCSQKFFLPLQVIIDFPVKNEKSIIQLFAYPISLHCD